jgi:hypothetical protein
MDIKALRQKKNNPGREGLALFTSSGANTLKKNGSPATQRLENPLSTILLLHGTREGASYTITANHLLNEFTDFEIIDNTIVFVNNLEAGKPLAYFRRNDNPLIDRFFRDNEQGLQSNPLEAIESYIEDELQKFEASCGVRWVPLKEQTAKQSEESLTDTWITVIRGMKVLRDAGYGPALEAFPQDYNGHVHSDGTNDIIAAKLEAGVLQVRFPKTKGI